MFAGFVRWLNQRREMSEERRCRRLQRYSNSPKSGGWLHDPLDPQQLYILGSCLNLSQSWDQGYSLEFLEEQYRKLKSQLVLEYPGQRAGNILIEVEACRSAALLQDHQLLTRLQPVVMRYHDTRTGRPTSDEVVYLVTNVMLDGDKVALRITADGYFIGYGMYVYNHPADPFAEGRWCLPNPDELALVAGEYTL